MQSTHDHAFYLPEDADGDGFIDHVVIFAKNGLTDDVQSKLGKNHTTMGAAEGRRYRR